MSVYHSLDEGVPSEVHAYDLSRKRKAGAAIDLPQPSFALADAVKARKAAPASEPLAPTFKWIASLPRGIRPLALLRKFPRIANRLANAWTDPVAVRDYLFDLLIDRRGGRDGFPQDVQSELLALRAYFDDQHVRFDRQGAAR